MRTTPRTQMALSWLAFVVGALFALFELANFGMSSPALNDDPTVRVLRWLTIAGTAIAGASFTVGSLIALRNRKAGAIVLFVAMPFAAFCLTTPAAGFLVWHADGGGYFESPLPRTALGLTVVFFAPFAVVLLAGKYRRLRIYLLAFSGVAAVVVFGVSRWTRVFLPILAGWSALFALLGLFWLTTQKRGWPPLRPSVQASVGRRLLSGTARLATVACIVVVSVFGFSALYSSTFSPDCSGHPLFSQPLFPGQSVFTARVLVVGRSLNSFQWKSLLSSSEKPWQVGDWAVARVERRFWGAPWPGVVLLTNGVFWRGEPYFIDGRRPRGLLTQYLPIIEAGPCARSKPAVEADLEFRMLQEGQPLYGTRIVGYAVGPVANSMYLERPRRRPYLSGVQVRLIGASGATITTTDKNGIYEFDRVNPGDYTIEAKSGADITHARPLRAEEMRRGSAVEADLFFGPNR